MLNHHFIQESISDCKINILFYRKPPPASLMMNFLITSQTMSRSKSVLRAIVVQQLLPLVPEPLDLKPTKVQCTITSFSYPIDSTIDEELYIREILIDACLKKTKTIKKYKKKSITKEN